MDLEPVLFRIYNQSEIIYVSKECDGRIPLSFHFKGIIYLVQFLKWNWNVIPCWEGKLRLQIAFGIDMLLIKSLQYEIVLISLRKE